MGGAITIIGNSTVNGIIVINYFNFIKLYINLFYYLIF
jgi:hypothetical protein